MFKNARIKLTAWYLLIIMFISIAFSLAIYQGLMSEVHRFSRMQRLRFFVDEDLITEIKQRIIFGLGVINTIILLTSGALGYLLAGKTLRPIQEMVEEQNRFVSDASHEFRTPLTALKSSLEVNLRDKNLSLANAKKLIEESIDDVNQLQSLSDSLLDLSQYQKPFSSSNMKKIFINDCLNDAIKKIKPLAKQKQISIKKNLENIEIKGVKDDLINLFVIVLDNAIKYSSKKTTIEITSKKTDHQLSIEIKDHGIGISEKDLPHIFDRFYRADQSRSKEKVIGYGLGLSIAKKIVLNHNGKIFATSKINKGTTFTVNLPVSV